MMNRHSFKFTAGIASVLLGLFALIAIGCDNPDIKTQIGVPSKITDLAAMKTGSREQHITLTWTPAANAVSYDIQRIHFNLFSSHTPDDSRFNTGMNYETADNFSATFTIVAKGIAPDTTSYDDVVSVAGNRSYSYRVVATNSVGSTASSIADSLFVFRSNDRVNPVIAAQSRSDGDGITVTWSGPSLSIFYIIERAATTRRITPADSEFVEVERVDAPTASYQDTNVMHDTYYYYRVFGNVMGARLPGYTQPGGIGSALFLDLPDTIAKPTATAGDGEVSVSWTEPANKPTAGTVTVTYDVQWRSATTEAGIATESWNDTNMATGIMDNSYADSGLTNGQHYQYRVRATWDKGISDTFRQQTGEWSVPSDIVSPTAAAP